MARLIEVWGWDSLDTITVPITTTHAIEKGTGTTVEVALTVMFRVLLVPLSGCSSGMGMQTPAVGIMAGGHWRRQ